MSQKYEKLKKLLKEMFQLDHPDLDFGLYRIMHAKAAEVTQFLDRDLLPQVKEAFSQYKTADKAELEQQLATAIEQARTLGADPESLPKVKELRAKIGTEAVDIASLESEVYDHLIHFFGRYYSEGDFLSKRRYSRDGRYAIPYDGEEVKLYWANHDQYYIKTSEYLRDYVFRLNPGDDRNPMRVHFQITEAAEGEHGNIKTTNGKDRVFILADADFASVEQDELVLRFEYRPATLSDWPEDIRTGKTKPPGQKELTEIAENRILGLSDTTLLPWISGLSKPHVKTDGETADYSRLRAHLNRYVARNTFDYFIHKDLGGFLRRELDFYIKNEVMQLDDIESETAPRVEQYLSKIKVLRRIAGKLIDFLAQLENFQKSLWLKKKFVVETQYCVALKEIPDEFLPEIVANEAQWDEWESLYHLSEIKQEEDHLFSNKLKLRSVEFLKANLSLMIDTRLFDKVFVIRLLDALGEIDDKTDGVLFHSENYQALSLMQARYKERVKCVYIDPPYNTDGSPISYKNGYKCSSWISLIHERLIAGINCLSETGVLCVTIDDFQQKELSYLVEDLFGKEHMLGSVSIRINPSGRITQDGLAVTHEYAIFSGRTSLSKLGRLPRSEQQSKRFNVLDDEGAFEWRNFRREGSSSERSARPRRFFPLYCKDRMIRVPRLEWVEGNRTYKVHEEPLASEKVCYPIDSSGTERVWRWGIDRVVENLSALEARFDVNGKVQVYYKYRPEEEGILAPTMWVDAKYSATEHGTGTLKKLFGERNLFSFPKSIYATEDCILISTDEEESCILLDYFAGSGTSGHAVINLNRHDGGRRQFILVEMADYFDTVLMPRLKKVAFTPEWKDGKPKRLSTLDDVERGPRVFKIVRLESYEDTLNNLESRRTEAQQSMLEAAEAKGPDRLREQYLLKYMLKVETQGSASLLNVSQFTDPTGYRLKVKRPGSDESHETCVDLIETFNWLLGLTVQHIAAPQTFSAEFERDSEKRLRIKGRLKQDAAGPFWFRTVTGTMPDGRKAIVIWRKLTGNPEEDNLVLDEWFTRQGYSSKDSEFGLIFVNGGNNLENLKTPDDLWKVRLIEDDFHRLMFAAEDE